MRLADLVEGLGLTLVRGGAGTEVTGVQHDSRRVRPGDLFACIPGQHADGHAFIGGAVAAGAAAVLVERDGPFPEAGAAAVVRAPSVRSALGPLAARVYGDPSRALTLVGITGTNGKTTTAYLVEGILEAAGRRAGMVGTIQYRCGTVVFEGERTTPEASDLQALLARMRDLGAEAVAMEVSSHALALGRAEGCAFDVGVFTNLTQDHLDFHGTLEAYFAAKATLFRKLGEGGKPAPTAVVNADDPWAPRLPVPAGVRRITFGLGAGADLRPEGITSSLEGIRGRFRTPAGTIPVASALPGQHNVANLLAATGAALACGVSAEAVARGIAAVRAVPGRFEKVEMGQPFGVVVDYAHTPDALERTLRTARELARGRVLVVFGCGGDRDRTKRPLMGAAAARLADLAILTSDNPRSERPEAILAEIEAGAQKAVDGPGRYVTIIERREAIAHALGLARPSDLVVLAGKGHETYQIMGSRTLPFDDRVVAREALQALGFGGRAPRAAERRGDAGDPA
jgi:UDP-N-acetylmuramoyl-L-alanyl-D-glutamate--2,6-diaminopimelate ligase